MASLPVLLALLAACASPRVPREACAEPVAAADAPATPPESPRSGLVAIVDGDAIGFATLRPALVEIAGQQALRDAILDVRLTRRLARAGLVVDEQALARERELLLSNLSDERETALELLAGLRARQGLGPARFDALIRRNAGLRALVAPAVVVDEDGLANAYDVLHGPKREVRVAVLASLAEAQRFTADLDGGSDFATLAVERSLDESAVRGGLLAPFARRDPSYPDALRAAAFTTAIGQVSPPALDGSRFYLVEVRREIPADGTPRESARARCEAILRLSRERLLMDALARELSSTEGATVFDRAFDPTR